MKPNLPAELLAQCREVDTKKVGIYFLIRGSDVVYVGQSVDVVTRVYVHASGKRFHFDAAIWLAVPECALDAYEGAFIRRLDPCETFTAPIGGDRDAEILAQYGLEPSESAKASFEARRSSRWGVQRGRAA